MIIEKINNNKIKIVFYSTELTKNNISLHSFLCNSSESKNFIIVLLNLANNEFGTQLNVDSAIIDIFSFNNKKFILFISNPINLSNNCSSFSDKKFFSHAVNMSNSSISNPVIYYFKNIDDVIDFTSYVANFFPKINITSSLYKYDNYFYLLIYIYKLNDENINKLVIALSEFNNSFTISNLCFSKFIEFSELLIKDNAIEKLQ